MHVFRPQYFLYLPVFWGRDVQNTDPVFPTTLAAELAGGQCDLLSSPVIGRGGSLSAIGDASPPWPLKGDIERGGVAVTLRRSRPTPRCPLSVLVMPLPGTLTVDTMATMAEESS